MGYNKRKSVPESYFLNLNKRFSETEDEGVDAGASSSSIDEKESISNRVEYLLPNMSTDELIQLEEYLKLSGFSTSDEEKIEESLTQLRSYVSKFLSLKINQVSLLIMVLYVYNLSIRTTYCYLTSQLLLAELEYIIK